MKEALHYSYLNMRYWNPGDCVDKSANTQNETEKYFWGPGMGYIFFSIYNAPKKQKKDGDIIKPAQPAQIKPESKESSKSGRPVLKPDNTFIIRIVYRIKAVPDSIKDVLSSLWLLANLSGLGARTRRGAGCFKIINLTVNGQKRESLLGNNQDFQPDLSGIPRFIMTPKETNLMFFKEGLMMIMTRWIPPTETNLPDRTCFRNGLSQILYLPGKTHESAFDLMERVGAAFQEIRKENPHDEAKAMHQSIADAVNGASYPLPPNITTLRKAYLGMPIIYNFRNNDKSLLKIPNSKKNATFEAKGVCLDGDGETRKTVFDRRASPLLFSFHNGNEMPHGIICYFPSELFPPRQKLMLHASYRDDKIDKLYDPPDDSFVLEVLKDLTKEFKAVDALSPEPIPAGPIKLIDFIKSLPVNEAVVRLDIHVDAITGKTCPCSRLYIKDSECISVVPGWTVKSQDVRCLGKLQKGSFLSGTLNPLSPTRLNDLKLEKNIVPE